MQEHFSSALTQLAAGADAPEPPRSSRPPRLSAVEPPPDSVHSVRRKLIANSAPMKRLLDALVPLAKTDITVTLLGETGTGKDVLAHTVHEFSPPARGPFVVFDCGAVAANLAESELLGHERGSFTGAFAGHVGAFERANGGTLFLDEIGELPLDLQPRLLRVLENRRVRRVGGTQDRAIDVRVLAATNRNLESEVAAGRFRQDLYFRLAGAIVPVPSLRERLEDLTSLVPQLLSDLGRKELNVAPETYEALRGHHWPGNVRELKNTLSCAIAFVEGPTLEAAHLRLRHQSEPPPSCDDDGDLERLPLAGLTLQQLERAAIKQTLYRANGNRAVAARGLGIAVSTLYEKLKKYNLWAWDATGGVNKLPSNCCMGPSRLDVCRSPMPTRRHRAVRVERFLRRALVLAAFALSLWPGRAHAYTWMLRHGYGQCLPCHVDPSGGGPLSQYGRGIGRSLLPTQYGNAAPDEAGGAGFLWNSVRLPDALLLGGDLRLMQMRRKIEGIKAERRLILMQADLNATVQLGRFVASASAGYAHEGGLGAAVTRKNRDNLVSRQHWLGYWLGESSVLVRAGRINLPYGVRSIEHTLWARSLTRTSINDDQQFGASVAFSSERFRGELMAIAGNYQLRPDDFRERGYSGFLEWSPEEKLGVGVSSLVTHRDLVQRLLREAWRHSHGAFVRWATPWEPLVLLSELDYTLLSPKNDQRREGVVGFVQADVEVTQGLHLIGTQEAHDVGIDGPPWSYGSWLSFAWFFAPQADIRIDNVYQSLGSETGRTDAFAILLQGHVYL